MAFADSQGTRIYYDDRGKGEPVLLCLTGWCVHHTIFLSLAERLSTQHRVLAVDWRGHGKSQASDQDLLVMPNCSAVRTFRDPSPAVRSP